MCELCVKLETIKYLGNIALVDPAVQQPLRGVFMEKYWIVLDCFLRLCSLDWFLFYSQDATQKSQKAFVHVASEIGAYEAEEIGMYYVLMSVSHIFSLLSEIEKKAFKAFWFQSLSSLLPSCQGEFVTHIRGCKDLIGKFYVLLYRCRASSKGC
jgi:hypothetical protein